MSTERDDARRLAWEDRTRGPFLVLAFVYLSAWTVVAIDERLSPLSIASAIVLVTIWMVFVVDYLVRLALAANRGRFFVSSIPDLLAAILPQLRPVVQLRHLSSVPFFSRRSGAAQRARIGVFAVSFAVVFVYSIALSVLVAERGAPGAVIVSLGDALWWACVTIFTVGYGDLYPVTPAGRMWAVTLMIGGVAIIGATSAIVVTYLAERIRHAPETDAPAGDDAAAPRGDTTPSKQASD